MNRQALIVSFILHVLILAMLLIHLPHRKSRETAPLIPLMVIPIAEFTASPRRAKAPDAPAPQDSTPTVAAPDEAALGNEEPTPTVVTPAPEIIKKLEAPSALKTPAEKKQPLPEPKPVSTAGASKKNKQANDFQSLLKNLQKSTPASTSNGTADGPTIDSDHIMDKLSLSELDALRQQLQRCWMIPAGARNAEGLVIEARVTMGPDAKVEHVELMDQGRMKKDSFFRAAAESAKRALYHPECTPLKLPLNKYEEWKTFLITFDPQEILK